MLEAWKKDVEAIDLEADYGSGRDSEDVNLPMRSCVCLGRLIGYARTSYTGCVLDS